MIVRAYIYEENMQPFDMATATNMTNGHTVVADLNGYIELPANNNDTIHIEAMGYVSKNYKAFEVPPRIIMQPAINELPAVEITAPKKKTNWLGIATGIAIVGAIIKYLTNE